MGKTIYFKNMINFYQFWATIDIEIIMSQK